MKIKSRSLFSLEVHVFILNYVLNLSRKIIYLRPPLEPTNQWYAIAKISGVKLCEAIFKKFQKQFISLMPSNLYGPYDNFDLKSSHVLPAMIRKFHEAKNNSKEVVLWGDGSSLRVFTCD